MTLIQASGLSKEYRTHSLVGKSRSKRAVEGVSLSINEGETVALLGRSGCGKSTLARLLVGLERPTSGEVQFRGRLLSALDSDGMKSFRRDVQLVFQDSPSAVNPRFPISRIIAEPLLHLTDMDDAARKNRVNQLLEMVELPTDIADRLPSQVSGGQLQRVCIARALAVNPRLIVLDEAVSNLDLHLQASALALLTKLQRDAGLAYLFVTHDLRLVRRFAARCIVMDEGRVVEQIAADRIDHVQHPASKLLRQSILPAMPGRNGERSSQEI